MLLRFDHYDPPQSYLWQGRADSLPGERFFQRITCVDLQKNAIPSNQTVFLGFCSDTGIERNQGHPGASHGPTALRQQLGGLASHTSKQFLDIGNITCSNNNLEASQDAFAKLIDHCHQQQCKTFAFGGGHEIAWPHFQGLAPHYPNLGIINIDAHFDVRPTLPNGQGTSGSPFWQIKQYCDENQRSFDYCCLGIQSCSNTQQLFDTATAWNVQYLTAEAMHSTPFTAHCAYIDAFITKHHHIYLTICLDVFAECFAPGVSARQPNGLTPWKVIPLLKYIMQTGKVVGLDIAELSPPRDHDNKTARLAALLVAELLKDK